MPATPTDDRVFRAVSDGEEYTQEPYTFIVRPEDRVFTGDWSLDAPPETPAERDFRNQCAAFKWIPSQLLERYQGQFVASRDGRIIDSDHDLDILTDRFVKTHGDVAVYIQKVGEDIPDQLDSPVEE